MKTSHNYLTREKYRDLLWIIGTSSKPLTTTQIKVKLEEKKGFEKTNSPYVYEMIKKNLHVGFIDSNFQYLFDWNKIPKDEYNTKRLLKYLKYPLKIDLENYDNIEILNNDNIIQIKIDSDKKIIMKKDSIQFVHVVFLNKDIQEKSFSFLIKNKNKICIPNLAENQLESFINLFYSKTILFLDKELKPYYQKLVDEKREIYKNLSDSQPAKKELNREIEELLRNDTFYVYSLNIRGLILYILAEIENESKINSERSKGKKRKISYNPQISRVIENLAKYYSSRFPFLYNYIEMRKIISKNNASDKFENHYEIKILRNIAEELKLQIYFDERYSNLDLDTNNNDLINYWMTKRYFTELYHYLVYINKFLDEDKKDELNILIKDYQEKMLILMKEYLEKETKTIQNLLSNN